MNKKKTFWRVVSVISIIVFICCGAYFIKNVFHDESEDGQDFRITQLQEDSNSVDDPKDTHGIQWSKIQKKNSDVYAWIYIPDTNVDYPVLQSGNGKDDFFYLDHNLEKKSSAAGAIYSEMQNATDFSDSVTVLYGHNMADGSMFASLHKFRDAKFFKKHKYLYIYTPEKKYTYYIYSTYVYDNRHLLNSFDFSDKKVFKEYLKTTQNPLSTVVNTRSLKKAGIHLSTNSKIITLSTCTKSYEGDTRYLVQGVLIKNE